MSVDTQGGAAREEGALHAFLEEARPLATLSHAVTNLHPPKIISKKIAGSKNYNCTVYTNVIAEVQGLAAPCEHGSVGLFV